MRLNNKTALYIVCALVTLANIALSFGDSTQDVVYTVLLGIATVYSPVKSAIEHRTN